MPLVLAIDIGPSAIKAGVLDEEGHLLSVAERRLTLQHPEADAAEHDPHQLMTLCLESMAEASQGRASEISVIVPSCYQFGLLFLNRSCEPLGGISTLCDTRARRTLSRFRESMDVTKVYQKTGCPPLFQHPLARLYYLRHHLPERMRQMAFICSLKAWVLFRLTGQLVSDPSTESASQMMNIHGRTWDFEILADAGITPEQCPLLVAPDGDGLEMLESVRSSLGLNPAVRVLPGVYDGAALLVGLGGLSKGVAVTDIGTSAMIRVVTEQPVLDYSPRMRLHTYYLFGSRYLAGAAVNNALSALRWLQNILASGSSNLGSAIQNSCRGAKNLYCIPYLNGERETLGGHFASGTLLGVRDHHTVDDISRAFAEGVAYSLALVRQALDDNQVGFKELRFGGGGARCYPWLELLGEVLHTPWSVAGCEECRLLGNAMLGLVFLGRFASVDEASAAMRKPLSIHEPDPAGVVEYGKRVQTYKQLYSGLEPMFELIETGGEE